jgi:hypothetical protein
VILHHDNVVAHSSLQVMQFLAGKASPPWIIHCTLLTWLHLTSGLFPELKSVLKGKRFSDVEDIKLKSKLSHL